MAKHHSDRRLGVWITLVVLGSLLGVAAFAWANHLADAGTVVAGRVVLDGQDLGGSTLPEVETAVSADAEKVLNRTIEIRIGDDSVTYQARELGFEYDQAATVTAVMSARRNGGMILQFASWALTPLAPSAAEIAWSLDATQATGVLQANPALTPVRVEEPQVVVDARGAMKAVPGVVGSTVDMPDLIRQLEEIDPTAPPSFILATLVAVDPTVTDASAGEMAAELNRITSSGVRVTVKGETVRLSAEHLRSHLVVEVGKGLIRPSFDIDSLQDGLGARIPEPVAPGVKPRMQVVDGDIEVIEEGRPPEVCCDRESTTALAALILAGDAPPFLPVHLKPRLLDDPLEQAYADGSLIVEEVSSFTTFHACCESRVTNIHRIADIVDGVYLLPGEVLSLNDFVGPRTRASGFVAAGAIRRGYLTDEIGGGVSQFATTFFNATFFAGLDFIEYRSHSIYFSRYPYGREATISSPAPDLVIQNTTAYPILVDTSYTDTSITVSFYSTANVTVEQLDQRTFRRNACTHVETDRLRTYLDGRKVVDMFIADYRPAEGIDCNGNPIILPPA